MEGYFSESEVVAWADAQILKSEQELSDPLMELSLKGPAFYENLDSYLFPPARKFSFIEKFSIRLSGLNFSSSESILQFCEWVSRKAIIEELNA
jgi:hypothetical protein